MKQTAAIVLTLLMLSSILKDVVVFLSFKINQQYIIENVCVEKGLLELNTCQGSCELTKQLLEVQTDNSTTEHPLPDFSAKKRDYVRESLAVKIQKPQALLNSSFADVDDLILVQSYIQSIFRPPQV